MAVILFLPILPSFYSLVIMPRPLTDCLPQYLSAPVPIPSAAFVRAAFLPACGALPS